MRVGLIVNPVAGLGGAVGLKGSDGADVQAQARALGAVPRSSDRATAALRTLATRLPAAPRSEGLVAQLDDTPSPLSLRTQSLGSSLHEHVGPVSTSDAAGAGFAGVAMVCVGGAWTAVPPDVCAAARNGSAAKPDRSDVNGIWSAAAPTVDATAGAVPATLAGAAATGGGIARESTSATGIALAARVAAAAAGGQAPSEVDGGGGGLRIVTAAGAMGEDAARAAGVGVEVVYHGAEPSTSADTRAAVRAMGDVDLLLFAGGDGTARDVLAAAVDVPVLGIPAGVKVYSGCFGISPYAAGVTAAAFTGTTIEAEVVDLVDDGIRLFGTVAVPANPHRLSGRKTGSSHVDPGSVDAIAADVVARMQPGVSYLLGPGSTTQAIGRLLGVECTPLGVDLIEDNRLVERDMPESMIYNWITRHTTYGVLSVLGGQGFVIGRGNQQLSPRVLAGLRGIEILATREKLAALGGRPLLADSGDPEVDKTLAGHVRVITGRHEATFYRLSSASEEL